MSGGVDSSAAALMLIEEGFDTVGVTMNISAAGNAAARAAAEVCRALGIAHFSLNLAEVFKKRVCDPFRLGYEGGETPNPCALCNERVKFGTAIDVVERAWGTDFDIASGHYAKIIRSGKEAFLARAADKKKDQSYFLSGIRKELLPRLRFPLGELSGKEETRQIARRGKLPAAESPESMEICFAGEHGYREIIGNSGRPGPIVDSSGKILGRHGGLAGYTPGQRKGLGVASRQPLFVVEIRPGDNTLVVAPRYAAFKKEVAASGLNRLMEGEISAGGRLYGKIRSQGEPLACEIISSTQETVSALFSEPVFAPAPGQRLVFYTCDGRVAAGATITRGGA